METQIERPQEGKDVHQDEQNHRRHDECHLKLVVAHSTRETVSLHILFCFVRDTLQALKQQPVISPMKLQIMVIYKNK